MFMALAFVAAALPVRAQEFWKDLKIPALPAYTTPKPEVYVLANGMRVYLMPDHSLPRVHGYLVVRSGALWEPADKTGLAEIAGEVMRSGGTVSRKGEQIDELLEGIGANVESAIGDDSASVSMFTLAGDEGTGLGILADLARNPRFPEDKLEIAKVAARDAIGRRNDEVEGIADREFGKLVYGADSPYVRQAEYATIESIHRADLVAFHATTFRPDAAMLGVVGDFDPAAMKKLIEKEFGTWQAPDKPIALPRPPATIQPGGFYAIVKDDVAQAQIRIGHLGGRRDDPDYPALWVMNEVLGNGSFSSRLFNEVRTKRGLAYFANGAWAAGYESPGSFVMSSATKNETSAETITVMVDTMRSMQKVAPTDAELRQAKDGILNSLVFLVDSPSKAMTRQMNYAYHGYPADFLEQLQQGVTRVTSADVLRVANSHLKPGSLVYLVAGKLSAAKPPLSSLGMGEPRMLDITIPAP